VQRQSPGDHEVSESPTVAPPPCIPHTAVRLQYCLAVRRQQSQWGWGMQALFTGLTFRGCRLLEPDLAVLPVGLHLNIRPLLIMIAVYP